MNRSMTRTDTEVDVEFEVGDGHRVALTVDNDPTYAHS